MSTDLRKAIARGQEGAGSLPAKDSVKVRPTDWHAIIDAGLSAATALESLQSDVERLTAERDEAKVNGHDSFKLACMWQDHTHAAEAKAAELEALLEISVFAPWFRTWCKRHFGRWITHNTAKAALAEFRSALAVKQEG